MIRKMKKKKGSPGWRRARVWAAQRAAPREIRAWLCLKRIKDVHAYTRIHVLKVPCSDLVSAMGELTLLRFLSEFRQSFVVLIIENSRVKSLRNTGHLWREDAGEENLTWMTARSRVRSTEGSSDRVSSLISLGTSLTASAAPSTGCSHTTEKKLWGFTHLVRRRWVNP